MAHASSIPQKIRTAPIPWLPTGHPFFKIARKIVNRWPLIRTTGKGNWAYAFHDGPLAEEDPRSLLLHGKKLKADPFQYMEDVTDRRAMKYFKNEQYHYSWIVNKLDLQMGKHRIWGELDARILITTREGGFDKGEERIGEYIYFTRTIHVDSSEVGFYRKKVGETDLLAEELINPHELKKQFGYAHCQVGICRVSENGRMIAYTLSVEGGDRFICHLRTTDSAAIFHVIRSSNIVSIEFGTANNFFYTECNELNRPYRIMMQELRPGLLPEPVEIYRDDDENFFVDVRKTKDGKYIAISSDAKTAGNVLVIPSSFPNIPKGLQPFFKDNKPIEIAGKEAWGWLEHHSNCFVMVTSIDAPNFKIVYCRDEVALRDGKNADWKEFMPHREDVQITDVDIFRSHLVLFETTFGFDKSSQLRVMEVDQGVEKALDRTTDRILHFPALATLTPGLNRNFDQDTISYTYSNIVTPARDCVYQLKNDLDPKMIRYMSPLHLYTNRQHENFTPWDYMWPWHMYRDVVTSHDGTQVPITICQKRDLFVEELTEFESLSNTPRHCLLYVYGSYGEVPSLHFQLAPYLWLIRRRWTIAFAHVRGGGELPGWAEAGKGRNKMNTIHDFMACCEWLHRQGFTTPRQLVVAGNSAGAVPIAAAANMRGNSLFDLALMRAPFLDIINTMCNPELPLSLAERADWGDPLNNEEDLKYLEKYDPYYNINDRVTYPSMMISTCLDDDRVPAWNALKYVAKLRKQRLNKKTVDPVANPLLLRILSSGGHYHWNEMLSISEELNVLIQQYDIPGPGQKVDDLDNMQQINNMFQSGLMDHDDSQQVFMKWEAWESEKIDFVTRMNKMTHEPNFRILQAKKDPWYWSAVPKDEPIIQAPSTGEEEGTQNFKRQRKATFGVDGVNRK